MAIPALHTPVPSNHPRWTTPRQTTVPLNISSQSPAMVKFIYLFIYTYNNIHKQSGFSVEVKSGRRGFNSNKITKPSKPVLIMSDTELPMYPLSTVSCSTVWLIVPTSSGCHVQPTTEVLLFKEAVMRTGYRPM